MSKSKKLNRDHAKKTQRPMVEDEVIANQLEALLTPAITAQENYYRQLGLRDRILNLPLMVAAVLTLLWRDVPGVTELTRILAREGFLWCNPTQISQQAVSNRFLTFKVEKVFSDSYSLGDRLIRARGLFYAVLMDLGDAIADELALPIDRISLEMIYRGLYHFSVAHQKGLTDNPLEYFTAPENRDLGIVKSLRKPPIRLIIAPFPERQKNSPDFFFSASSQTQLTTALQA